MAADSADRSPRLMWDDFQQGFSIGSPTATWFYFSAGSCVGDDGITTTSAQGLRVVASGTHPQTGEPAFRRTLGQEAENGGLPGSLDHVKWLVYLNHMSARGYPGFDVVPGQTLTCEAWLSGRTFGTAAHPFVAVIADPNDDVRLACCAMNTLDFETGLVFNFFLTNARIYVLYERLPFVITVSRVAGKLRLWSIGEWQFKHSPDYPTYTLLMQVTEGQLKLTGEHPMHDLELPNTFWGV